MTPKKRPIKTNQTTREYKIRRKKQKSHNTAQNVRRCRRESDKRRSGEGVRASAVWQHRGGRGSPAQNGDER